MLNPYEETLIMEKTETGITCLSQTCFFHNSVGDHSMGHHPTMNGIPDIMKVPLDAHPLLWQQYIIMFPLMFLYM